MTTFTSKHANGKSPIANVLAALPAFLLLEYITEANLATGDIIDLGPLPPGVHVIDSAIISDDLDTGSATITMSLGLLNAGKTDLNGGTNETWITASTVAQAGGIARASTNASYLLGASASERRIGLKVAAGAATGTGAGEKIAVLLTVKA
jgi:hypothetical protein